MNYISLTYDYGDWFVGISPKGAKPGMEYQDSDDQDIIHERSHHASLEDVVDYLKHEYSERYEHLVQSGAVSYDSNLEEVCPKIKDLNWVCVNKSVSLSKKDSVERNDIYGEFIIYDGKDEELGK